MSWVEKNRKINNQGGGGEGGRIIRDSRVVFTVINLNYMISSSTMLHWVVLNNLCDNA